MMKKRTKSIIRTTARDGMMHPMDRELAMRATQERLSSWTANQQKVCDDFLNHTHN